MTGRKGTILGGKKQEDLTKLRFREKDSGEVAFQTVFYGDDVFARKKSGTWYRQLPIIVIGLQIQSQQALSRAVRLKEGPSDHSEVSKGEEAAG